MKIHDTKCWKINFLFLRLVETFLQNIEGWKIPVIICREVVLATLVGPRTKPLLSLQRRQHLFGKSKENFPWANQMFSNVQARI